MKENQILLFRSIIIICLKQNWVQLCDSWLMSCVKLRASCNCKYYSAQHQQQQPFFYQPKASFSLLSTTLSVSKNQTLVWLPLPSLSLFSSLLSLLSITTFFKLGVIAKEDVKSWWWMMMAQTTSHPLRKGLPCPLISTFFFPMLFQCLFKSWGKWNAKLLVVGTVTQVPNLGQRVNGHQPMNHSVKGWMVCEQETTFHCM